MNGKIPKWTAMIMILILWAFTGYSIAYILYIGFSPTMAWLPFMYIIYLPFTAFGCYRAYIVRNL